MVNSSMMALSHGFASLAVVALTTPLLSETASPLLLAAAFLGGLAPDLDVVAAHRKSLHFPIGYSVLAAVLAGWYAYTPTSAGLLATVFIGAAALHACSDILAGSVEPEPWNPTTERAVYNHVLAGWHRPRRIVRYSGAPEDFLLGAVCACAALLAPSTGPTADALLLWLVAAAGGYSLARKHLSDISTRLVSRLPSNLKPWVPAIRVEETESGATRVAVRRR